jgi:hypothetical protein
MYCKGALTGMGINIRRDDWNTWCNYTILTNVERRDPMEEAQMLWLVYPIDDRDPYGLLVKKRRTIHMACWSIREGLDPSRGVRRRAPAAPLHWKRKASIQWRLSLLLLLS